MKRSLFNKLSDALGFGQREPEVIEQPTFSFSEPGPLFNIPDDVLPALNDLLSTDTSNLNFSFEEDRALPEPEGTFSESFTCPETGKPSHYYRSPEDDKLHKIVDGDDYKKAAAQLDEDLRIKATFSGHWSIAWGNKRQVIEMPSAEDAYLREIRDKSISPSMSGRPLECGSGYQSEPRVAQSRPPQMTTVLTEDQMAAQKARERKTVSETARIIKTSRRSGCTR